MKKAEFRNEKGKWVAINILNQTADPQQTAFNHCRQFNVATRVVDNNNGKDEVLHEFRCQKKARTKKV
jgi:hypothetical protein